MKLLSSATVYGIRAALYIATHRKEGFIPVRTLAEHLKISYHFLAKVVQRLTQTGILDSHRGPTGGVALGRPAGEITLFAMVKAIEGDEFFSRCILDLPGCGEEKPCSLHQFWGKMRNDMLKMFQETTLEHLGDDLREGDLGLLRI